MKRILITLFSVMIITTTQAEENPFFLPFEGPHGTAPFQEIKITHYEPAFEKAMAEHSAEIDQITANAAAPTFANTIEAMEYAGEMLDRVGNIFFNLLSAESNDEMMEISQRLTAKLSEHSNNINLNEALFRRVKEIGRAHV